MAHPVPSTNAAEEASTVLGHIKSHWRAELSVFILGSAFSICLAIAKGFLLSTLPYIHDARCSLHLATCNLSYASALRIARSIDSIGHNALDVTPFRDLGSDEQYIAVAVTNHDDMNSTIFIPDFSVHLIHAAGDAYLDQRTRLIGFAQFLRRDKLYQVRRDYGVQDMDGDGSKEVYAVRESIGNAFQTWWITVLDRRNSVYYHAYATSNLNITRPNLHISPTVPFAIQNWMAEEADKLAGVTSQNTSEPSLTAALQEWIADNGYGAVDDLRFTGDSVQLRIRSFRGYPPAVRWSHSVLHDGSVDWILFFKGPVVRYDRSNNTYSVIIYSQSGAWYGVHAAISGKRYIWLQEETLPRILVVNKATKVVEAIQYRPQSVTALLHVIRGRPYIGSLRVPVPRNINLKGEFVRPKLAIGFP